MPQEPQPQPVLPPEPREVRRHQLTSLGAVAALCLALPSIALLTLGPDTPARRGNALWLIGTAVAGAVLPFLYWSRYRALGIVPYAALLWVAAAAHGVYWDEWPAWAHGTLAGLIAGALARGRRGREPGEDLLFLVVPLALGLLLAWLVRDEGRPFTLAGWVVLAVALALLLWSAVRYFRSATELASEPPLWMMYDVRATGPGLEAMPLTGPCLVIANHACWLDPLFAGKVFPRPVTPMMISRFYDLPVIRWFMRAFGVIRVQEKTLKKDAPEIQEAIAALDRGECVLIFPEGFLRRTEERVLRRFGQGVWQILKSRPDIPVVAAWIEGAWGSYTSYANGPPMKNKKKDVRRPIRIGVSAPVVVPPELLTDHLRTRTHLMNLVSGARAHIGLDPLPRFELPTQSDDGDDEKDSPTAEQ